MCSFSLIRQKPAGNKPPIIIPPFLIFIKGNLFFGGLLRRRRQFLQPNVGDHLVLHTADLKVIALIIHGKIIAWHRDPVKSGGHKTVQCLRWHHSSLRRCQKGSNDHGKLRYRNTRGVYICVHTLSTFFGTKEKTLIKNCKLSQMPGNFRPNSEQIFFI